MTGISRAEANALSWDELEARGLDDCGQPLEGHPPLTTPRPLGRPPKHPLQHAGGRRTAAVQPTLFRHRGRGIVIRAEHSR